MPSVFVGNPSLNAKRVNDNVHLSKVDSRQEHSGTTELETLGNDGVGELSAFDLFYLRKAF
ncbi:MAG: hypothetical protein LBV16_08295 [Elusimicrobiota bacterium]|nr:hypothetical protein [Elusimicrobiota bacterium]